MARVGDLGEDALIARIAARIGRPPDGEVWTGDDAAILGMASDVMLFTTDLLLEGVDFDLAWAAPADVGWKVVATNASDLAAMGGRPLHALLALCLEPNVEVAFVDDLLDGVLAAAKRWGIALVGGDLSRGRELVASVAMLGATEGAPPRRRSTARIGDAICVTGALGGAAGGLRLLRRGAVSSTSASDAVRRVAVRQLRPQARVEEGLLLASGGATAMMDVSDGLAADLTRLLVASGVGCDVDPDSIPVDRDLEALTASGQLDGDALELAVTGGEDFELLFTIEPGRVSAARAMLGAVGCPVTQLGVVVQGARRMGGVDLETWRRRGWDHLRNA